MSFIIDPYRFGLPPVLDVYPGAGAAYSVRKLRTAYNGNCIRVRRSSDNNEQDIGFNGTNLDTNVLSSFCGSGSGFVTTWYDQSGNNRNATQTTAVNQPKIYTSGNVDLLNAKPVLNFDGSNDILGISNFITGFNNLAVFMVQKTNNISTGISLNLIDAAEAIYLPWLNRSAYFYGSGNISTNVSTNRRLVSLYSNTTTAIINFNAVAGGSRANGTISWSGGHFIGSYPGLPSNVSYQELIIYITNQTTNVSGIEFNINNYFNIY